LVLPVEAHSTASAPRSTAAEIAVVIPRSLNDPVGLRPSYFRCTSAPTRSDRCPAGMSGVPPSRSVMTVRSTCGGNRSAYSVITPRHWCAMSSLLCLRSVGGSEQRQQVLGQGAEGPAAVADRVLLLGGVLGQGAPV